jgi:hypothetical protein
MTATILPMPGIQAPRQEIAHFLRIGHSGHKQLETLHGKGRFPAQRVVVDASKLKFQKELISALRAAEAEIVLDTNVAELSALARFDGAVRTAPWAEVGDGGPLRPEHFASTHSGDIISQIARFAVVHCVDAVLAPGHFLRQGHRDEWFDVDRGACAALRDALDREGGKQIEIDYLLMPTYTHLQDEAVRGAFLLGLQSLPFSNLWIRASGFGADGTPLGARRYITALSGLHNLGKPVIADNIGGLIGLAAVAFGAASGLAHGVGVHERFNAGGWEKPRKKKEEGAGGGSQVRVTIPGLDRSATIDELEVLAKSRGGHRLVVCGDRNCCLHGIDDMKKNWRAHFLHQRFSRSVLLEKIPDHNRTRHFLDNDMAEADRLARQVKDLKTGDKELTNRLIKHSRRMEAMRGVLESLCEARGDGVARARASARRNGQAQNRRGEM